ncbi:MAG: FAD-dependent oxidoreductase [Acidimicrobiales bacterium]
MGTRLLVVGGDAAGMSAASQARRRLPDLDIVVLERGRWTSYSACGIPFVVGGEVDQVEDLVVRGPREFRDRFRIDARTGHDAVALDLDARTVEVVDHGHDRTYQLGFDILHLATGARPTRPELAGVDLPHVHGVQTLEDAAHLLDHVQGDGPGHVVVVGGGYIGLEMAEAFVRRGCGSVTIVEQGPEVMGTLDPDMGSLVTGALRRRGVVVRTGLSVTGFTPDRVVTAEGEWPADLVILGLGVVPDTALAAGAGLVTGVKGAVVVDTRQQTSADGVWAAGDCCQTFHLVSRAPVHVPLGTHANKQGRVAGINIGGGYANFPGVVGTAVTRICDTEVGRTGLSSAEADRAGLAYEVATVTSSTRAGYYPGAGEIVVKMLAERGSGRLLGAQLVGGEGAAKRVDVVATALTAAMTADDLIGLDLAYAPPFSPVWDPVQVAARRLAVVS